MPTIIVHTLESETVEIDADEGDSLMEAITENDIDGVDAICGGSLSCATCHVHVTEKWLNQLEGASDTEKELLSGVNNVTSASRLSCQITLSDEMDGLEISIA